MKKVFKLMAVTGVMFGLSISAISAIIDTKTIGEGKTVSLKYGKAGVKDKKTSSSYSFQTTGECTNSGHRLQYM